MFSGLLSPKIFQDQREPMRLNDFPRMTAVVALRRPRKEKTLVAEALKEVKVPVDKPQLLLAPEWC